MEETEEADEDPAEGMSEKRLKVVSVKRFCFLNSSL
jgi:hypothetical protein